eukprot:TRINITY_DN43569_c0_g1_i1.p1 TRINITY_DN43569_c0_g1~~TRINITY_DN43569_c0_g1_i1.p1  ORF type:complete len:106 (-),score=8.04 TRINITY_DN43569_c0_g1_i1:430-747(-)
MSNTPCLDYRLPSVSSLICNRSRLKYGDDRCAVLHHCLPCKAACKAAPASLGCQAWCKSSKAARILDEGWIPVELRNDFFNIFRRCGEFVEEPSVTIDPDRWPTA